MGGGGRAALGQGTGPSPGGISVMSESPGLYPRLSVPDNLEFFAGLYGVRGPRLHADRGVFCGWSASGPRPEIRRGAVEGCASGSPLARALLPGPAVLFLDEPTWGLDPMASAEFRELLEEPRDGGVTIFLTTHRLDEAGACATGSRS